MDRLGGSFGQHDSDDHLDFDVGYEDSSAEAPPSPVGQDERRMQVRAYNHWASLLADRNFPHIEDLYPEELDDFGPYSVLLDFSLGIEDPMVQYVGGKLAEECQGDGKPIEKLSDVPSRSLLSRITDHYMQILANQAPIGFEAEFVNQSGQTVLYRGILLPYSSDDETIDFIYGVINWKEMADQQTADELLLEIDQALGAEAANEDDAEGEDEDVPGVATAETLAEPQELDTPFEDEAVLELSSAEMMADRADGELPRPAFGQSEPGGASKSGRGVDALGNPIGAGAHFDAPENSFGDDDDEGSFDSGMKTAADYGLPDWDDEPEEEDVDDVVDPLGDDDDATSSLTSLVSRGMRTKKSVDLSSTGPRAAVPHAYEGEGVNLPFDYQNYTSAAEPEADTDTDPVATFEETAHEADDFSSDSEPSVPAEAPEALEDEDEIASADGDAVPEGLYDCLASARELAQAALNTEDRSRKALYAAVGRAYDFSLEAVANPADYEELIADNGLSVQDRAPMTPIVKLVFGADYDKTRLTEYAAVLTHAHRLGVGRGGLVPWLRNAEGGLKGVVNAERRARKEEQGKPVEDGRSVRAALAKKLRKLEPFALADLPEDGPEFALIMVRRTETGDLVVLGELPEDVPLIEKAARKLLG